ncbi:MAG: nucleotidyl transferase AbiEii/AbiGii toxin family protein [Thermoleophilia bacterium]
MAHLVLRYEDVAGRSAALKLDLNFLDRVPVLDPVRLPLRHPFSADLQVSPVLTFALDELAASKVIALARRSLARDLFDVAELAQAPQLDLDLARTVLVVRGAAYPPPSPEEYASDAGERVRLVDWRSQVVALALRGRAADLADARLRSASLLGELLALKPAQARFLRALEEGELNPVLLETPALEGSVAANPGLLWRVQRGAEGLEEWACPALTDTIIMLPEPPSGLAVLLRRPPV